MYSRIDRDSFSVRTRESRGNVWSGVVALALLAMFTVALIASETDSRGDSKASAPTTMVIAGQ